MTRINIRSTKEAKNVIEQAAGLLGLSISSFILQSSLDRANELLRASYQLKANNSDREMLMNLLENPPPAKKEMKDLMKWLLKYEENHDY